MNYKKTKYTTLSKENTDSTMVLGLIKYWDYFTDGFPKNLFNASVRLFT